MSQIVTPEQLRASLHADRYVVVRKFLPPQVLWIAYRYALLKVQNGQLDTITDTQVPNTPAVYSDTLMEVLLEGATAAVESVVGEPLYPSYSYLRVYKHGDRLAPHIDRPSCEISMTVCLGYNVTGAADPGYCWPIKVDNSMDYFGHHEKAAQPAGLEDGKSVLLEPGDGLIYFGTGLRHWRDAFPGDHQAQVFFHFVRRTGPHAGHKFDGRPMLGAALAGRQVATKPAPPVKPAPPGEAGGTTTGQPQDVLVVEGFLNEQQIGLLLQCSERGKAASALTGVVDAEGKVTRVQHTGFEASRIEMTAYMSAWGPICDPLFRQRVPERFGLDVEWYEVPHILRYQEGGRYDVHADSEQQDPVTGMWVRGVDRDISILIYLDDQFQGGALYFPGLDLRVTPKRGMLVCFPSDHRYAHVAEPVTSGVRHVFVTWAAARGSARVYASPPMPVVRISETD